jgi:predicted dehydrogenase
LDQIVYLFGLPNAVTAFIGTQRTKENNPTDFPKYFTVICHYPNGMSATAKGTCISPEAEQLRYWVRGEKGSFKKNTTSMSKNRNSGIET